MKRTILLFMATFCMSEFALAGWCSEGDAQFTCMMNTINGESRGEGYNGMLMVGKAIATRMKRGYKSSVCRVVSGAAFAQRSSYPTSGDANKTANANIKKAAKAACAMTSDQGVTHFHSYRKKLDSRAPWASQFSYVGKVGNHHFFNAPMSVKTSDEMDGAPGFILDSTPVEGQIIQEPSYIDVDERDSGTIINI